MRHIRVACTLLMKRVFDNACKCTEPVEPALHGRRLVGRVSSAIVESLDGRSNRCGLKLVLLIRELDGGTLMLATNAGKHAFIGFLIHTRASNDGDKAIRGGKFCSEQTIHGISGRVEIWWTTE